MRKSSILKISAILAIMIFIAGCVSEQSGNDYEEGIHLLEVSEVKVEDSFWRPRFEQWRTVTANDMLDKFEGRLHKDEESRLANDVFRNFDLVAEGKRDIGHHAGFPWFDGLIYETIRGISDYLACYPDPDMEKRVDSYIDRIAAAQASEKDGYLNTYTMLMESGHRWGENGGMLRWQHDVYNAGMLIEAGVHYYKATGKTKLLEIATRFANMMCETIGEEPKKNVVPAHSGPEEALVKLYLLYKNDPKIKGKVNVPVNEESYFKLAEFFIENRGHHCGYPLWGTWGNPKSEQWIRDCKYADPSFGSHSRPTWGDYAQDSIPVFEQQTIEGHAVRATLMATGLTAAAIQNHSEEYEDAAKRLWDNMAGRRMFITGGVGAVHFDEKFGPDYYLPTDAYLETCAAVGAGFFSQRMNELTGDGKYMDELERTLYNNVLTGISLSGVNYTYQNPLNADKHERWEWHDCPCCPPMFLKITSAVPGFIYAFNEDNLYVNLFIGSETSVPLDKTTVSVKQETEYPWNGKISIEVSPAKSSEFTVSLRIPGWARGIENPYGLYSSDLKGEVELKVNGAAVPVKIEDGYVPITRKWKEGDAIELVLPMQPRIIKANPKVETLDNLIAISAGPIVYCIEGCDNENLSEICIPSDTKMSVEYDGNMLGGINVVKGDAVNASGEHVNFTAIPYYALGNREKGSPYKVWIPEKI
jgi:DUF1680 family protein